MSEDIEQLKITELKSRLCQAAKQSRATMAPMLYWLREKIKDQGKAGKGFGPWVEKHLDITRRTADRWADEWAKKNGRKKAPTSGQKSKGGRTEPEEIQISDGPGKVLCNLSLRLTQSEEEELLFTWGLLGDEDATRLICDTFRQAGKAKAEEEASPEPFPVEDGELQDIRPVSTKRAAQTVKAGSSIVTIANGESI